MQVVVAAKGAVQVGEMDHLVAVVMGAGREPEVVV